MTSHIESDGTTETVNSRYIQGEIVRLNEFSGFGYVKVASSMRQYFFKLSRIEGHHGRSLKEMGIKVGTPVLFMVDNLERVEAVRIIEFP